MDFHKSTATIRITNLALQTIIGYNEWERHKKQNIIINITIEFDHLAAVESDDLRSTIDYKEIKNKIITEVENSSCKLLEKLTDHILDIIMSNPRVLQTTVRIDKPHALRYTDSVSIEISAQRKP
jgi:D-erythro-7,8-dihydroneopterin triphosphate epimerase